MLLNSALISLFLSTPSARRATAFRDSSTIIKQISIHALREEGDIAYALMGSALIVFLSTPSARRATKVSPGSTSST